MLTLYCLSCIMFFMTDFERKEVGNMDPEMIHQQSIYYDLDNPRPTPSIAEDWRSLGITYELTDPVPTDTYTTEQLRAMGICGVTLIIPKPETTLDS